MEVGYRRRDVPARLVILRATFCIFRVDTTCENVLGRFCMRWHVTFHYMTYRITTLTPPKTDSASALHRPPRLCQHSIRNSYDWMYVLMDLVYEVWCRYGSTSACDIAHGGGTSNTLLAVAEMQNDARFDANAVPDNNEYRTSVQTYNCLYTK